MSKIKYKFRNPDLFLLALTQSGVDSDHNNERLEFIGDRVLGLSVASLLYEMFPNETEGDLARRHATLVSTDTLAKVAKDLGIAAEIRHGHMTAGRTKHILADAMEAVLGAIFLDGGFEEANKVVVDIWANLAKAEVAVPKDFKTALQEFVQKNSKGELPIYEMIEEIGAAHNPIFTVKVSAMGSCAIGKGASKKQASLVAAEELLKILAI